MDIAAQYVKANYKLEESIKAYEFAPYNFRCHINSYNNAKLKEWWKVVGCYQLGKGDIIAHFINKDEKGELRETTQGYAGIDCFDYYIVKEFDISEFVKEAFDNPLDVLKYNLFNMSFQNKFLNKFFKLNPYDYF